MVGPFVFIRRHYHGVIDGLPSTCYTKAFISIRGIVTTCATHRIETLKTMSSYSFAPEQPKISEQRPSESYMYLHSPLRSHIETLGVADTVCF